MFFLLEYALSPQISSMVKLPAVASGARGKLPFLYGSIDVAAMTPGDRMEAAKARKLVQQVIQRASTASDVQMMLDGRSYWSQNQLEIPVKVTFK